MSAINLIDQTGFSYEQLPWGDLIYGTKPQIQNIGIAVEMAFPGEPGGPKRLLRVLDPRGSVVLIHAISLSPALDASLPEMRGPILV